MRLSLSRPERSYATIEIAPSSTPNTLGVAQGSTAYGSDNRTGMDLIGLTAGESAEMQPPNRFFVYDQMRKEDAAVKSALWLLKQPIRSALWTLVPASPDAVDQIIADAIRWQFGLDTYTTRLDLSWREQIAQKMMMFDYGCMFEEIMVPQDRIDIFYDQDGDPHPIRPFSRLAPRWPQSIRFPDGIVTDEETGFIKTLTQWVPGSRPIPGQKLCWYVLDREGTDWLGTSLLRPMYGSWKLKRAVMISAGIGWDRFAFGTPIIRYPKDGGDMRKKEAEAIGRNWRTHERGYFVLEGVPEDGWDVNIEGSGQMSDPTPLIHTYDEQIAAAALQHFVVLGRTATGSRAVGDALSEPYYMFLQTQADDIAEAIQRFVFRKWVDLNFGPEFDCPQLNVSKLASRNVAVLAAAIAALADAGFSFTDRDTQNDIRDILDLRQLPEPVVDAIESIDAADPGVGIAGTPDGGPAATAGLNNLRQPTANQNGVGQRAALAEGRGLGY